MFDWFLHLLGLCPDHSSHLNLLDYFTYIGLGIFTFFTTFLKLIFHKLFHKKCKCDSKELTNNFKIQKENVREFSKKKH